MRQYPVRLAPAFALGLTSLTTLTTGCFSSSSGSGPDASFDGAFADSAFGDDVSQGPDAAPDAGVDATTSDAAMDTGTFDSATLDSGTADATHDAAADGGPADATTRDAADAALGGGTVSSSASLQLTTFRQGHTGTLLANGKVLFCGGLQVGQPAMSSCDVFDPVANTITAGPSMTVGRYLHGASLLPSGQVLVAGGITTNAEIASAEIYDPSANAFTAVVNPMSVTRAEGPAVLLISGPAAGKVLLVGGVGGSLPDAAPAQSTLASLDLFDPGDASAVLGTFSLLPAQLGLPRAQPAAVALQSGGLVALGGAQTANDDTAEVTDAGLGAFAPTANTMSASRSMPSAALLPDGRVFIVGGNGLVATADLYDPATRSFTSVTLPEPSTYQTAVTLRSGHVMIAEGRNASGDTGTIYVFDPATGTFATATGGLNPPRVLPTATLLADGRVMIAGGQSAQGLIVPSVDIFTE